MKCTDCSKVIRPIVAVDIDGTIANYHRHFFRFAAQWLGRNDDWQAWDENFHGGELNKFMGLDKRTYRQIKLAYRQGGMKRSMPMMHGAVQLLAELLQMEVEIWLTTTRPYLQVGNVDEDTREWLRRYRVPFDHLLYADDKYSELVKQVDKGRIACVLDDQVQPEYIEARLIGLNPIFAMSQYNSGESWLIGDTVKDEDIANDLFEAAEIVDTRVRAWREQHAAAGH